MNYLIETNSLKTIEKHLEFDDFFLAKINKLQTSLYLRIWEVDDYCIILGRSNKEETEAYNELANKLKINIIKRSSGGGTVVLGPGCLCYSAFIPTSFSKCSTISKTNDYVMNQLKSGLSSYMKNIEIKGFTDLCIKNKKFSGNAQRRLKDALLFHGTFLYDFDLRIIFNLLKHPSKEPVYRNNRPHDEFIANLDLSREKIIHSIITAFSCKDNLQINF